MIFDPSEIDPKCSTRSPQTVAERSSIAGLAFSKRPDKVEDGRLHIVTPLSDFVRHLFDPPSEFRRVDLLVFKVMGFAVCEGDSISS